MMGKYIVTKTTICVVEDGKFALFFWKNVFVELPAYYLVK